ncbi:ChbG/HpnK family deacetylase, partial [Clostridium perfringens]|nr:ChbG/HpnK family deacetylase [Clostridium perfringens]
MRLIINADDFGLSRGVNYGIIDAHKNGVIKSTSIMAGMPGFDHAVEFLKDCPELGCGVHLTLSAYKPVLKTHKTIVDENGYFYKRIYNKKVEDFDLNEIYNEFCAQIEKVKAWGINITHIDSHHHIHMSEILKPVIEKILEKYNFPIRGGLRYDLNYNKIVPYEGI